MSAKYFVYRDGQKQATIFKSFKKACDFACEQLFKDEDELYIDECLNHGVYRLATMRQRDNQAHLICEVLGGLPND